MYERAIESLVPGIGWRDASTYARLTATWPVGAPALPDQATLDVERVRLNVLDAETDAMSAINTTAGLGRQAFMTTTPGQAEAYLKKEEQARAYKAAGYTGAVPEFVQAEADATAATAQAAADSIIALADAMIVAGADIDRERRTGIVAVEAAAAADDIGGITVARDAAVTAIQAL